MKFASALMMLIGVISPERRATAADLPEVLPSISELIELAYPTWCIDANENRLYDVDRCADGSVNGKWNPIYLTKQYSGADPSLGGYPTPLDINYAFEYASPYLGQPCAGSPHHCPEDFDGSTKNCKQCPKVETRVDNGPYGPGHVPPHITLAAVTKAYYGKTAGDVSSWFDYDQNACRILPSKMLQIVRMYYPRDAVTGDVYYPPPYSIAGGSYPLEFANLAGESCEKAKSAHPIAGDIDCFNVHSGSSADFPSSIIEVGYGTPHYCSVESAAVGVSSDYCPYITFGPNRGRYRHPHIAYSALETYLANKIMPEVCGVTWDDSDYPPSPGVDNTQAFPEMTLVEPGSLIVDHDQPTITKEGLWIWPGSEGTKKKAVVGNFANSYCVVNDYFAPNDNVFDATDKNSGIDSLSGNQLINKGGVGAGRSKVAIGAVWVLGMMMSLHYLVV